MRNKYFETSVGFFIILGVLCLLFLVFKVSGTSLKSFHSQEYTITAEFKNVGSLRKNAAVKISGVEVGRVTNISLKDVYNGFIAVVTMSINNDQKIPANYSASIAMSGILGDSYIALTPSYDDVESIAGISDSSSGDEQYLHQGSVIPLEHTQSAIDLGSLINTFIASGKTEEKTKK
ncbi:MAG: outer membrane lipid asymmetry maintenance protein MlaD [Francisella sp.]